MTSGSSAQILPFIEQGNDFLLLSHIHPDGDSIGSLLGLADLLGQLGKNYTIASQDEVPQIFRFLKDSDRIIVGEAGLKPRYQEVIVLDLSESRRAGDLSKYIEKANVVINIDHHQENQFAEPRYVRTNACATGELIYELFQEAGLEPSVHGAEALYTAIMTDTGRFSHGNTTYEALAIASDLVRLGARPHDQYVEIYEKKPLEFIRLLGKVLDTLELSCGGRVASLVIDEQVTDGFSIDTGDTENYIAYAQMIKGVEIALLFREVEGNTKISWRSIADIDVSLFARHFGGGGHKNAAGCELELKPRMAQAEVLQFLAGEYC